MDGLKVLESIVKKASAEKIPSCDVTSAVMAKLMKRTTAETTADDLLGYTPLRVIDFSFAAASSVAAAAAIIFALSYYQASSDFISSVVYNLYSVSNFGMISGV